MSSTIKRIKKLLLFTPIVTLFACEELFSYHPYDGKLDGKKNINITNITSIGKCTSGKDTIRFAFMSDSHLWFDGMRAIEEHINNDATINFVIHGGDITDCASTSEFRWARDELQKLKKPYVVLLGNHDCVATGFDVWMKMFGIENFSFIAGRTKFICLNTNSMEYDYTAAVPDLNFIENEIKKDSTQYDQVIVAMHAHPQTEIFNQNITKVFEAYLNRIPKLQFCICGHGHSTKIEDIFDDGLLYYQVGDCNKRQYIKFTVYKGGYEYEIVSV